MRITFDLEEKDLRYFQSIMRNARKSAKEGSEEEILSRAEDVLANVKAAKAKVPNFVLTRISRLRSLIEMVRDEDWKLEGPDRFRVVSSLAYFADPHDLIPDTVPVMGYIDDAIMIELVFKELGPEFEAYQDFCRYRREEKSLNRSPSMGREQWLAAKRTSLHGRMHRRRQASGLTSSGIKLF